MDQSSPSLASCELLLSLVKPDAITLGRQRPGTQHCRVPKNSDLGNEIGVCLVSDLQEVAALAFEAARRYFE